MENRTALKEKRNEWLWLIWTTLTIVFSFIFPIICLTEDKSVDFGEKIFLSAVLFCCISVAYRLLVFCFNSFLAKLVKKRFKIDRLKGRVTPIYEMKEGIESFIIRKFSVVYTPLNLEWSVPFSVLFEEQEYLLEDSYKFFKEQGYILEEIKDISLLWEERDASEKLKHNKKISEKIIKQQKIDNLNKQFNENYK